MSGIMFRLIYGTYIEPYLCLRMCLQAGVVCRDHDIGLSQAAGFWHGSSSSPLAFILKLSCSADVFECSEAKDVKMRANPTQGRGGYPRLKARAQRTRGTGQLLRTSSRSEGRPSHRDPHHGRSSSTRVGLKEVLPQKNQDVCHLPVSLTSQYTANQPVLASIENLGLLRCLAMRNHAASGPGKTLITLNSIQLESAGPPVPLHKWWHAHLLRALWPYSLAPTCR